MKLAYLANIRFPSERAHSAQIVHMCQSFVKAGCSVDLFVSKRTEAETNKVEDFIGFTPKFLIKQLRPKKIYPKLKITFSFGEFWFAFQFFLKGKSSKYDYVFSRSEYILWFLSFFISNHKLVWESHDGRKGLLARSIMRKGVLVIVTSKKQKDLFSDYTEKILVAPNGVDNSFFEPLISSSEARERLGLDKDGSYAMYIGGFDLWKGVETFFEASKYDSGFTYVVIGGGDEEVSEYKEKYPNVLFLGSRPYRDLVYYQQAANVLVVPNTAKNEMSKEYTSPLKLFAHITSGVPVLITDIPSLTNVVGEPDVTVCKPDDPENMAQSLKEIKNDYKEKLSRAKLLREKSQCYTWENRAQKIMEFLNR